MSRSLAITVVLLIAAGLRLAAPGIDPEPRFGTAHLSDEGYYTRNAKELVQHGQLIFDGDNHNHLWLAPATCLSFVPAFAFLGVSIESARVSSGLAGLVLLLAAMMVLDRSYGRRTALLGGLVLAVEPALIAASRVALAEGLLATATTLFALALVRDLGQRRMPWLSTAAFAGAMLVKASAIALIPVGAVVFLLDGLGRRELARGMSRTLAWIAVSSTVVLLWCLYVGVVPGARFMLAYEFGAHVSGEGWLGPLLMLADSITTKHAVSAFASNPVLLGLGITGASLVLIEAFTARRPRPIEVVATSWLLTLGLFHSAMPYQPPRYFLALAAPAALLAAPFLGEPREQLRRWSSLPLWRLATALPLGLGSVAIAVALRVGGLSRFESMVLGIAIAMLLDTTARRASHIGLAVMVLLVPTVVLVRWALGAADTGRQIRRELELRIGPSDLVVGYFADSFALGSQARAAVVHGPWNPGPCALERLGATYLLVREEELRWLLDRDPSLVERIASLDSYRPEDGVRGILTLYRVSGPSPACIGAVRAPDGH